MGMDIRYEIEKIWNTQLADDVANSYLGAWSGMEEELILYAAQLTAENIEKPSFPYMNAIINNWEQKGIKTVQAAKEQNKGYEAGKKKKSAGVPEKTSPVKDDYVLKAELLAFIRDIEEDMPKYMQSKAEKAGFVNACCQIATFLEHK